ncbi:titin [Plakobranchus ocellatus]|uniref:Titin n=1 Tax=Plakobranchus ocellatus TaxID=259542 RepID=A0AAV3YP77_9GAST|nr:titin [Plakobranchus ocellatus]
MGSYISRSTKLRDYAKPLMTLSGELDGQTRITRIAVDYEQLQQDAKQNKTALYRKPVVNIKGLCHAQFASGPMPHEVVVNDLKPDITEKQAHAEIGRYVSHFLTVTFSTIKLEVTEAKMQLHHNFKESGTRFQPLLNVKALDMAGNTCPWAQVVQGHLARKLVSRTNINNKILSKLEFASSKPSLARVDNRLIINTIATISYEKNDLDISLHKESPLEISIKMTSRQAIEKALGFDPEIEVLKLNKKSIATCRFMNEQAVHLALRSSIIAAQERYRKRGRPLTFKDDVVYESESQWLAASLALDEDDKGLSVQSVALYVPMSSAVFPGMYYCKVLSPYRAMEWINVDSLRPHNLAV